MSTSLSLLSTAPALPTKIPVVSPAQQHQVPLTAHSHSRRHFKQTKKHRRIDLLFQPAIVLTEGPAWGQQSQKKSQNVAPRGTSHPQILGKTLELLLLPEAKCYEGQDKFTRFPLSHAQTASSMLQQAAPEMHSLKKSYASGPHLCFSPSHSC